MPTVKTIGRSNLREMTAEMNAAVQAVAAKYGVSITYKGARFTALNATTKFEIAVKSTVTTPEGVTQSVETPERVNFRTHQFEHGLPLTALDSIVAIQGDQYRIKGYNPRRPKFPFSVTKVKSGRAFKMTLSTVQHAYNTKTV
jgi:hypothetical protein